MLGIVNFWNSNSNECEIVNYETDELLHGKRLLLHIIIIIIIVSVTCHDERSCVLWIQSMVLCVNAMILITCKLFIF